jgi:hypothetical protein
MKTIELIATVDDQHRLSVEVPADVKPGPVKIVLTVPTDQKDDDDGLRALINRSWAQDWSDPREDFYTFEDGKPSHELK